MRTQTTDRSLERHTSRFEVTGRKGPRTRGTYSTHERSSASRTREKLTPLIPAMGVANRAPGVPIMGDPSDPRFVDSLFATAQRN